MMNTRRALVALACCIWTSAVAAQPPAALDAAERRIALERLRVVGSVLYVGAHPDDENTAFLAYLARERKVRVAYLSLTRGDGGQNLIGTEQGSTLGVIRTEELLAARAIDGAEQRFTRAIDFGYSKTAEETLRSWDRDKVLADVVWAIRSFRPDVIVTRFPPTGEGGHGHHTASAILAREAFDAAADPSRYPEQLAEVGTWQAKRLLWNIFRAQGTGASAGPPVLSVDLGTYSPVLGKSYTEIAAESRSMHKSQGFGAAARRGANLNYFSLSAGEPAPSDFLDGVDLTWKRIPGGERVDEHLARAAAAATDANPEAAVPHLLAALAAMNALPPQPIIACKREQTLAAIQACLGLWLEATAADERVTPGATTKVTATVLNRSRTPITLRSVSVMDAEPWSAEATVAPGGTAVSHTFTVTVPRDAAPSQPYWLEEPPANGTYVVRDQRLVGRPRQPPLLSARFALRVGTQEVVYTQAVSYRFTDPVEGDVYRPLVVVPAVTVDLGEPLLVFPNAQPRTLRVRVHAQRADVHGALRLVAPNGWHVTPERAPFALGRLGEEAAVDFTVIPPPTSAAGTLTALLDGDGGQAARSLSVVEHYHIPRTTLLPRAQSRLLRVDIAPGASQVGYVAGAGDDIPAVLRQLGIAVTTLTDEDLATRDLRPFGAIVTGVRAYNTRDALRPVQERLMSYVKGGGTLVVQYNVDRGLVTDQIAPFPLALSRDRITEEATPVRILAPENPLLRIPHRIGAGDFDGWVQERGLYFPHSWDAQFTPLLAMHDTGEADTEGSLLVARYGQGAYVYTGLAFFRQLPAGVPGALRLFVNLLSAGHSELGVRGPSPAQATPRP